MRHHYDSIDIVQLLVSAALLSVLLCPAAGQSRPRLDFVRNGGPTSNTIVLMCEDNEGDPIPNANFYNNGTFEATQSDGMHDVTLTPEGEGAWTCQRSNGSGGLSEPLLLAGSYTTSCSYSYDILCNRFSRIPCERQIQA